MSYRLTKEAWIMKRSALVVGSLLALGCFAGGQDVPPGEKTAPPETEAAKVPPKRKRGAGKKNRLANLFFRAFYMQYGENKPGIAEKLYLKYLEEAGENGRFASRAAEEAAGLLEKEGRTDQARELRERYIRKIEAKSRRKKGRHRGEGNPRDKDAWVARVEKQIAAMKARLEKLRESGAGEADLESLSTRIERMSNVLEKVKTGEIPPPGWSYQGRARRGLNLAGMDPVRRESLLERVLEKARKAAERLEQKGDADQSRALLDKCSRIEALVKEEKWEEASRLLLTLRPKRGPGGDLRRGRRWGRRSGPSGKRGGRRGKARGMRGKGRRRAGGRGGGKDFGGDGRQEKIGRCDGGVL